MRSKLSILENGVTLKRVEGEHVAVSVSVEMGNISKLYLCFSGPVLVPHPGAAASLFVFPCPRDVPLCI